MTLPSEIRRMVVEAIRDPDESLASLDPNRLRREKWLEENRTLLALSLTSKIWTIDATSELWSDIHIEDGLSDEEWATQIQMLVQCTKMGHTNRLRRFTIFSHALVSLPDNIVPLVRDILSRSSALRCLQIVLRHQWQALVPFLPTLSFLNLRSFGVILFTYGEELREDQKSLEQFLVKQRTLENVESHSGWSTMLCNPTHLPELREACPLPKLKFFRGYLSDLRMLASSQYLRSLSLVERGEESDFLQGLSLLANPFSNVIHITLLPPRQIYFGRLSLRALSTSFPALKTIEGLLLFPASLEFIESQIEIPEPSTHLVRLEEVTLYEICKSGNYSAQQLIPALEDASVERAFKSLRSLFPSIALAKHVRYELSRKEGFRGTRRQISIMTMHYLSSSAGNHFETTIERSNGRSMTLTVI